MAKNIGTCKLCLTPAIQLKDSHFVPRSMYKLLRQIGKRNPNPVRVTEAGITQTSLQEKAYVLCGDCEHLLNKGGEGYASRVCWRSASDFKLRKMLQSATPIHQGGPNRTMRAFLSSRIPGLDVAKLTYFGSSILWRASIWSSLHPDLHQASLDSESQESFRLFLKGESSFPKNASVMLTIVDEPQNNHVSTKQY